MMKEPHKIDCHQNEVKDLANICNNFHGAIEFIGKRWMGIIIFTLLGGPKRYHEILEAIPGISDRLLTERLRDLEKEGILVKKILNNSPKMVEYELTSVGRELENVILAIKKWIQESERARNKGE